MSLIDTLKKIITSKVEESSGQWALSYEGRILFSFNNDQIERLELYLALLLREKEEKERLMLDWTYWDGLRTKSLGDLTNEAVLKAFIYIMVVSTSIEDTIKNINLFREGKDMPSVLLSRNPLFASNLKEIYISLFNSVNDESIQSSIVAGVGIGVGAIGKQQQEGNRTADLTYLKKQQKDRASNRDGINKLIGEKPK
jgi:hypothetical protein